MKKRLIFHVYIDFAYRNSKIYDIHIWNLKKYAYRFDCATFVFCVKDFTNETLLFMSELMAKFMEISINDIEIKVTKNTGFREANTFNDEVVSRIKNGDNEVIFFGHTKGLTNMVNSSLINWVCACYYYSLNFDDELNDFLYVAQDFNHKHYCFYGFPLIVGLKTIEDNCDFSTKYDYIFGGCFFWIKLENYRNELFINKSECPNMCNRVFAEDFPGNSLPLYCVLTHKNVFLSFFNYYYYFEDALNIYYDEFVKDFHEQMCFKRYVNNMVSEININV